MPSVLLFELIDFVSSVVPCSSSRSAAANEALLTIPRVAGGPLISAERGLTRTSPGSFAINIFDNMRSPIVGCFIISESRF
jgi:hypothetical protein